MKLDIKKITKKTKDVLKKYRKQVGSSLVVMAMVASCGISLADRAKANKVPTGTMMSVSKVAKEEQTVAPTFSVAATSHEDMVNMSYQTSQLDQIELADKQVDEVLASERPDRKDQATIDALTAAGEYEIVAEVAPEPEEEKPKEETAVVTQEADPVVAGPITYTYADANGTYEYLGDYLLTAYCPCPICCGAYSNMESPRTASGTTPAAGRTVAAPSDFAFGTKLNIGGVIFTVEDRGGAINGKHLDIYFNTHAEALAFGMRTVAVFRVVE